MDYSLVKVLDIDDAQTISNHMKSLRYRMFEMDLDTLIPKMPRVYSSASDELRKAIFAEFLSNAISALANEFSSFFEIAVMGDGSTWSDPVFNESIVRSLTKKFYKIYDDADIINIHTMTEDNIKAITIAMYVFIEAYITETGVTKITPAAD